MTTTEDTPLSSLAQRARVLYQTKLGPLLEPDHTGQAVAVHVDTADYEVGPTHSEAARALLARHGADRRIVTLTIGPPTDADLRLAARFA